MYFSHTFRIALALAAGPTLALAQGLTNAGGTLYVPPGAALYVGPGGLRNQAGGTLTNAGTLRVDGTLVNPGVLDLSTGTLEVRGDLTNTGTLTPGTSAVTFSGPADQVLTPGGASLYQLLLNKTTAGANTLSLAGDLTVNNLLSLTSGLLTTKAPGGPVYTLRLPAGASLSGEASGRYVLGSLAITRTAVSGAAVSFGHGATLDPTTNNLGTVTITRTAGLQTANVSYGQNVGGTTKSIDRIWTVVPATQPSAAVQLTLSWLPDDDNGLTSFAQASGWQQAASGQPWAMVGAPANASGRSILLLPTVLNRFTVSNAANPLPVVPGTPQAAGFVVYPTRVAVGQAATYLYTGAAEPATLRVLDMVGRLVRTVAVDGRAQGEVPLGGLAAGAYVLRYTTATASFMGRCVVE